MVNGFKSLYEIDFIIDEVGKIYIFKFWFVLFLWEINIEKKYIYIYIALLMNFLIYRTII